MDTRNIRWLCAFGLISLFGSYSATAEEQTAAPSAQDSSAQMGGMQHSMEGMQHGGMNEGAQGQGGMAGMQHGGMSGGGMMGGMGGGMMSSMTDQQLEDAWQKLQAQDIRLGELRRQMREATDQAVREKLKGEHRSVLKEQLGLAHKLMMQEHMKSMKGGMSMGGQPAQTPGHPGSP